MSMLFRSLVSWQTEGARGFRPDSRGSSWARMVVLVRGRVNPIRMRVLLENASATQLASGKNPDEHLAEQHFCGAVFPDRNQEERTVVKHGQVFAQRIGFHARVFLEHQQMKDSRPR